MQLLSGWKVWYFLQISVPFWAVWLLSCQEVRAKRIECYECSITMKCPDSDKDPCFDPKKFGAKTRVCSDAPVEPAESLACYKGYNKDYENSDYSPFLTRTCRYAKKNDTACYRLGSDNKRCQCNDRDLCNDEPGYEVSEGNFDGSRPTGSKVSIAVSTRFRLPCTVLALLSGCIGFVPKISHNTIHHGY